MKNCRKNFVAGITPRSLIASVFGLLLAGMYTQFALVINEECYLIPESAIPIPAMLVMVLFLLIVGGLSALFKFRLLTKTELICVAFSMLLAVPMMTQGFWHRFVGVTSAPMRTGAFDYMDAYSDSLWPHGPNLLKDALKEDAASAGNVAWEEKEYEEGVTEKIPLLQNASATEESYLSFPIKVVRGDSASPKPDQPHLVSVLAHSENLENESEIFCRVFSDGGDVPMMLFSEKKADKKTYLHKKGFVRFGAYGVIPAQACTNEFVVQLGIRGRGKVWFADTKLMNVQTLEAVFRGRTIISEADYNALPENERPSGVIIKPTNMWSLKGVTYFLKGYIPLRDWVRPACVWGFYMLCLCAAFFCINVLMRKKWAESERYPMPNTKAILSLVGVGDEEKNDSPFSAIWKNRYAWAGFAVALLYGIFKGWHFYNPRIPDISMEFNIGDYVTNPTFGGMFSVSFIFSMFILSIAVFFELNVLISIVLGFWFCRIIYMIGYVTDIKVNSGFPWRDEQTIGSYIGYFVVVLALSWKYIWGVIKEAVRGAPREEGDVMSRRVALIVFLLCHIGIVLWAHYVGASKLSMLVMFCFFVMVGFVAAKMRAECGSPFGYFSPYNSMLFVTVCGGMTVFGAPGLLNSLILSGFLTVTVFYLIPGMQFEMVEIGKRMSIQPRHIAITCLLGLLGGLFVGGWVFLSNAYAMGGDNIRFQWAFNGLDWFMNQYRSALNTTTSEWLAAAKSDGGAAIQTSANWGGRMMVYGGVMTVIFTVLRQLFAGFWFHPLGFLLGTTHLNDGANWGTLLVAWAVRGLVLKVGGATAVRSKLQPFFVGAFVGCLAAIAIFSVINAISRATGSSLFYNGIP